MFSELVHALARYQVILEPDQNTPEWWAGAPSVVRGDDGSFYLAARMREGHSPRGMRGYEIRILQSRDGYHYEPILHLRREDVRVPGFERPALVRVPETGLYRLYLCAGLERGWAILRCEDTQDPARLDPHTVRRVLWEDYPDDGFVHVTGYKDPFILHEGKLWHMFVIGTDRVERVWHFVSEDGDRWEHAEPGPFMDNSGWHNFATRPACVVPLGVGYLFVYEGANLSWRDPVYNIATGLAYSPDLTHCLDLTPEAPLLMSTTPGQYHTWRYSHWLPVGERLFVYFEAARPNNTNEIRLGVISSHA